MDIQCARPYIQPIFLYHISHSILAHLTRSISRSKFPPRSFYNQKKKEKTISTIKRVKKKNEYPLILIHGSLHHGLSDGWITTACLLLPSTGNRPRICRGTSCNNRSGRNIRGSFDVAGVGRKFGRPLIPARKISFLRARYLAVVANTPQG